MTRLKKRRVNMERCDCCERMMDVRSMSSVGDNIYYACYVCRSKQSEEEIVLIIEEKERVNE